MWHSELEQMRTEGWLHQTNNIAGTCATLTSLFLKSRQSNRFISCLQWLAFTCCSPSDSELDQFVRVVASVVLVLNVNVCDLKVQVTK